LRGQFDSAPRHHFTPWGGKCPSKL